MEWRETSDWEEGLGTLYILYATILGFASNVFSILRYSVWLYECVHSDASNINGHMVTGEASLLQFLLGEEYKIQNRDFLSLLHNC